MEQANNKPTIVFAISPEKDKLAAASAQKIFLYSLPDLKVLEVIPLHHVHRILWLDNDVFYVVTVSGYVAVWSPEQEKMKWVGKWADSIWSEQDVFSAERTNLLQAISATGSAPLTLQIIAHAVYFMTKSMFSKSPESKTSDFMVSCLSK